jgi:hypothetical protein
VSVIHVTNLTPGSDNPTSGVRKSCLCLCTSSVSVDQWASQFKLWTNLGDREIVRFTSQVKVGPVRLLNVVCLPIA